MRRLLPILLALAAGLAAPPAAAQPPLNISADNVRGSRGPEGDIVLLNGNVRITRGRTVITADQGRYLRSQGMLYLDDRVRLVDSTTTLRCDHAAYSETQDLLQVSGNVVIVDRGATLRAPFGTYDRKNARAELYGGVNAEDTTQTVRAEQVTYWRERQTLNARGKVVGEGRKDDMTLRAETVDYDRRSHVAVATGDPVLEARGDDGKVAEIRAVTLKLNTETRVAEAIDSVRMVRDTLQATGRYGVFDDRGDRGWLYGDPRAWDDETTITGDTLEVWTEQRAVRRFIVRSNAVLDYRGIRPGKVGETSKLTGDQMTVFFTDEEIDSLVAIGGAKNAYQAVAQPGKTPEINLAEGDTITIRFEDEEIERAIVRGKAHGEYRFAVDVADTAGARAEVVRYEATRIEYQVAKDRIVLDPGARLVYRDLALNARRVEFDIDDEVLVASGDPQLVDRGDQVSGHLMTYDLQSRQGTIYQAETTYERGLYHGERIRKVDDDELDVKNGSYSTCSLEQPHYHFQARWMKIFLKDKLVAKPVVFYVKNVPLLALPFWVFPIKPGRHSGFIFPQFELGLSNRAGQFVRNAGYYWAPNDYMDLTVAGDYYQAEPTWLIRGEGNYKLLYRLEGQFVGTFARNERTERDEYRFNATHAQEISPRTRLTSRGDFVSSRDYSKSNLFGNPLSLRLERFLTSSLALSHTADWASFSLFMDRRQDLDADQSITDPDGFGPLRGPAPGTLASLPNLTQNLPNLSVTFPTRAIGSFGPLKNTPFARALASMYFSLDARVQAQRIRQGFVERYLVNPDTSVAETTTVIGQRITDRWGSASDVSLSDSRRLFGWLNVAPRVAASGVLFDRDNLGNKVVPTGSWRTSLTSSANFYGTMRPRWGNLIGIRHVVFPSVSYSYSPSFEHLLFTDSLGVRRDRFTGFSGIGASGFRSSTMSFSLDQRWQVKLQKGDQVNRLDNLLQWFTSASYNFLAEEQGQERALSPIGSTVRLSPPRYVGADLSWTTNVYEKRPLRSLSYNVNLNLTGATRSSSTPELPLERRAVPDEVDFTEPWSLGLAFSYSGGIAGNEWSSTKHLNAVTRFNLTPNWRLEYSANADLTSRELGTQRFGLVRDLHCWQASFTRIFVAGGEAEYYFRLGVKDQKEIYIERGTRIGSIGGIQ